MAVEIEVVKMSFILFNQGGRSIARIPLVGRPLHLGSSPAMDFTLPDKSLPACLCRFEPLGLLDYHLKTDLPEGVLIDGKAKKSVRLYGGETIQVSDYEIVFNRAALDTSEWMPAETTAIEPRCTGTLRLDDKNLTLKSENLVLSFLNNDKRKVFQVGAAGFKVGAHQDNDLVLDDSYCSGLHAYFYWQNQRLFIQDLDSTNGVLVNGVSVQKTEVKPGFRIQIGTSVLEVLEQEERITIPALKGTGPWSLGELKTCDKAFAQTLKLVEKVAVFEATVCIFGETGTGKELVAQAIHDYSAKRTGPFIALNCAAIPEKLIESQLFGHEKGAFTGADRQVIGAFEQAQNGTLFLDEIGELAIDMQAKLLRVLETMQVKRVGGKKEIKLNFRLVTATHRDLPNAVAQGLFREDLLHRLYVLPVELSPLRKRPKDIQYLANLFLKEMTPAETSWKLTKGAEKKLLQHPFKGNVRELKNLIQRAILFAEKSLVTEENILFLPSGLQKKPEQVLNYMPGMTMEEIERIAYDGALGVHRSAAAAATALGIPKTTFWRRAKQLNVLRSSD